MNAKKWLTIILAMTVVACDTRTTEEVIQAAQQNFSNNNYRESVVLLKNVVASEPENREARLLLAKSHLKLGSLDAALKDYSVLERMNTDISLLFPHYAEALYRTESYVELIDKTESIESFEHSSLLYRALAFVRTGESEAANALLRELSNGEPSSTQQLAEAYMLVGAGKLKEGLEELSLIENTEPHSFQTERFKAQLYSSLGRYTKSAEVLSKLSQDAPFDNTLKFYLAVEHTKNNDFASAMPIVNDLLEIAPKQPLLNRIKGYSKINEDNLEEGLSLLEVAHQNGQKSDRLLMDMAQLSYTLGYNEKAFRYFSLVESPPDKRVHENLKLAIFLRLGYELDSMPQLLSDAESVSTETAAKVGLQLLDQNKVDSSKQIYERLRYEGSLDGDQDFGLLGVKLGDVSAIEIIEKHYIEEPTSRNRALLASSLLKFEQIEKAEKLAAKWIETGEDELAGHQALANIALKENNLNDAETHMQAIIQLDERNRFARMFFAQKAAQAGDTQRAQASFKELLEEFPNSSNLLKIAYNSLKPQDGASFIVASIKDRQWNINQQDMVEVVSSIYLSEGLISEIIPILSSFASANKLTEQSWNNYLTALRGAGDLQKSLAANKEWTRFDKDGLSAHMNLIVSYELLSDTKEALKTISYIKSRFGESISLSLTQVNFLIIDRQIDKAKNLLADLGEDERVRELPFYKGLNGRIAFLERDFESAVDGLTAEYAEIKNEKTLKYLVSALRGAGNTQKGIELLQEHINQNPNDLVTLMQLAELAESVSSPIASEAYQKILKVDSNNLFAVNNYALILLEGGAYSEAESLINRILAKNNNHPDIVDTAVQIKAAKGEIETANSLYMLLLGTNKSPYVMFNYLKYLTSTNQLDLAKSFCETHCSQLSVYGEKLTDLRNKWQ